MAKHDLQQVIRIGEELFRTQGYYHTGTEEILEKSKFPRSSFYYHFKNKEGYAVRVLESYGAGAVSFYRSVLQNREILSPKERFKTLFSLVSQKSQERNFKSQCLIQKMSGECAPNSEGIRKATDAELTKMLAVFADCIAEGQQIGEFQQSVAAAALAHYLHAQLYGAHTLCRLSKDAGAFEHNLDLALEFISN